MHSEGHHLHIPWMNRNIKTKMRKGTVYTEEQGKLDTPLMEKVYLTQKRGRNNP